MDISFRDNKLRKNCEDSKLLKKTFGNRAQKIAQRLAEFAAAEYLDDIAKLPGPRLHPLKGEYAGYFAVYINHPFRIVIKPLNGDKNDYKTITKIEIVGIRDYH